MAGINTSLFRMAKENEVYTGGGQQLVSSWKGWNICPLVCYDLRFPVWSRNAWDDEKKAMAYDALIYVANWPSARVAAWDSLLKARAIENLSYVVGVNRIGPDGHGVEYNGHSAVIDPKGTVLWFGEDHEQIKTVILEAEPLADFRAKFPAYLDGDNFKIT